VKAEKNAKVPFGTAKFSKIKNVRYLSWEDAFDVEFNGGKEERVPRERRRGFIFPGRVGILPAGFGILPKRTLLFLNASRAGAGTSPSSRSSDEG
jgi:hypothetical protein